jgi:hypothetical protein
MERESSSRFLLVVSALVSIAAVTGCNQVPIDTGSVTGTGGGGATTTPTGTGSGSQVPVPTPTVTTTPAPKPTVTPSPTPTPAPTNTAQCVSSDPNRICLSLKIVSYQDSNGATSINRADANTLVQQINNIWNTCNIAFELDQYESVDPTTVGLSYGGASESQLNSIRSQYSDSTSMLVAVPGPWTGRTIAWTSMPGGGPFGTIVESQYGHNPMTVGHELGHYQGLYHISDSSNLMNPYIGSNTSALNTSQCNTARQTDQSDWQRMMRK